VALDTIIREVLVDAPIEVVWSVLTTPEHLAGWFSDEVEIDLRPGGEMWLTWHDHGRFKAVVERVEPPRLFAFRWLRREGNDPASGDGSTLVEFTLSVEEDRTRLRVRESGFGGLPWPDPEKRIYAEENREGWRIELDELLDFVATLPA
jgi:uncharacterized protein YndB with AHSA1/START domain